MPILRYTRFNSALDGRMMYGLVLWQVKDLLADVTDILHYELVKVFSLPVVNLI